MNTKVPAPGWFTPVAIIALLWNLLGCVMYLFTALLPKMITPEVLATLPEADRVATEAQLAQLAATPSWVLWAFAIATIAGLLGSILLLMKKNLAVPVFAVSLVAVIAQDIHTFFLAKSTVAGVGAMIVPILVLVIAAFLLWLSLKAKKEGWSS